MRATKPVGLGVCVTLLMLGTSGRADAQDGEKKPFSSMAPVEEYRMADRSEEIALARSAAPASISREADVLVLGDRGYETAIKGKNGFVCLVRGLRVLESKKPRADLPQRGGREYGPACRSGENAVGAGRCLEDRNDCPEQIFAECAPSARAGVNGLHDVQAGPSERFRGTLAPTFDGLSAAYGSLRLGSKSSRFSRLGPGGRSERGHRLFCPAGQVVRRHVRIQGLADWRSCAVTRPRVSAVRA